jgi:cold shock CspA family protein
MRKINLVLLIAAIVICVAGLVTADPNQQDINMVNFQIGTTAAGAAVNSNIFRVPQNAVIDSVYITDLGGCASSETDTAIVTMFLNNGAYGFFTTASSAIVAVTPKALTPTGVVLAAGDIVQFKLTKGASGQATTNMGVTIAYHNANR